MITIAVRFLKGLALSAPALFLLAAAPADPVPVPLGLLPIVWPKDNPYTPEKAELGRLLYFDKRLSADGTGACASCPVPHLALGQFPVLPLLSRRQESVDSTPGSRCEDLL